ncbi:hypothetical protein GCM10010977_29190 [Citricoccus zhacaiensis]|uniref:Uncharacterized protein n=1 Tax=Citricoccus zhacaiensis TaxID=489142 RepID=A0ABQ2MAH6_9MICC|nr:hypothetical protein GCM10010977_29190 [Citricoccus zhacaiensis]
MNCILFGDVEVTPVPQDATLRTVGTNALAAVGLGLGYQPADAQED